MEANKRWERVEELFHATLQLEPSERAEYLSDQCAGDPELLREVESLVTEAESQGNFIEESAMSLTLKIMSDGKSGSLAGQVIGHYKILKLLGFGGMGEVYLAEDSNLERLVALKFLSSGFDDEWAKAQLMREARAIAQLDHPNICGIYGIEQIDGHNFIVMQYIEGDDVSCLLKQGSVGLEEALNFAEQLARALSAAHSRKIIHRDVKPKNALVGPDGQIKILDFGLAKYVQTNTRTNPAGQLDQTQAGTVIGTVAYMSPEQTRGDSLTAATDVFSLGIFLYEIFSGTNPFLRETKEETIDALGKYDPPELTNLPNGFGKIVERCLHKEAHLRYSDAGEVLKDIQTSLARRHANGPLRHRLWQLKYIAAAAVFIFAIGFVAARMVYVKASQVHSLVVMPIANKSDDTAVVDVSEGFTRTLVEKFSYLPRLKVRFPTIPTTGREKIDPVEVGRTLRADQVLYGEILKVDGARKLHLVLMSTDDGQKTWDETIDLETTNMLTLQDYITQQVAANMGLWLIGREKNLIAKRQTHDEEAMKLYVRGQQYWAKRRDREDVQQAINFFEQAIARDSAFAKAYAGLAEAYTMGSTITYGSMPTKQAMDRARWAARQALQLEESAEAHTSMGAVRLRYDWEWDKAEEEFKRAIALNPEYANAHYHYANLLAILRRPEEAVKESLVARDLEPYSPTAETNYGRALYYSRRFDEAEVHFQTLLNRSPNVPQFLNIMGLVQLQKNNVEGAVSTLERLYSNSSQNKWMAAAALGYAYGKAGRFADANKIIQELDEVAKERPVPPQEKAIIYLGMGEMDKAFQQLEASYSEHFSSLAYLTTDPLYEDLQSDPRYAELARRMRLPTTPYLATASSR